MKTHPPRPSRHRSPSSRTPSGRFMKLKRSEIPKDKVKIIQNSLQIATNFRRSSQIDETEACDMASGVILNSFEDTVHHSDSSYRNFTKGRTDFKKLELRTISIYEYQFANQKHGLSVCFHRGRRFGLSLKICHFNKKIKNINNNAIKDTIMMVEVFFVI